MNTKQIIYKAFNGILIVGALLLFSCRGNDVRKDILLNDNWLSVANDTNQIAYLGFEDSHYELEEWQKVTVPHNWDDYGGMRRLMHGNRHGYAWYRRTLEVEKPNEEKRYFLYFEGVGSYATVWVNGIEVGKHAGGRTTFTLDITEAICFDKENILAVRADHPADIRDLPWVCGGCSSEWGFSEGSQPMGIFRPVHLIETNPIRIEPFGVHAWNENNITEKSARVYVNVEVKNYSAEVNELTVKNTLISPSGSTVMQVKSKVTLPSKATEIIRQMFDPVQEPKLWSIENPYLYTIVSEVYNNGRLIDREETPYGIRKIKWDIFGKNATNRFYLNDKPVFINGTAEYEHILGQSHAFSDEQVKARVDQMKAMGFNSFRDAHQPHNFRYHYEWDKSGIVWWPQMAAHIWFDNPEFRANFKQLLRDWVKERRNSPSVILWGLENESTLPEDFASECADIIREMDPTTSWQRLVTTCNGGSGTDWNVVQNWSGTYGGKPEIYDEELSVQLLNGEYGAWRSIDLHSEGEFDAKGILSEDRMTLLMESKIRLGEKAAGKACGQYHWLFNSHENPGRTQSGEGYRDIDRLGPVNYKGTVTAWGEPLDSYYMFRSNYIDNKKEPMLYIASHTWPDRWLTPGKKDGIRIYSNCDEVELFNGVQKNSLGKQKRGPIGTHYIFNGVDIKTNVLYAVGYVDGKAVAEDVIVMHHLPKDPDLNTLAGDAQPLSEENENVIYRVNCGGAQYTDAQGNTWLADVHKQSKNTWGSVSWTDDYADMPAFYGSQRYTYDPIQGTNDWPLIQSFRYGRHKLKYQFPVPDGEYKIDMYFTEPWYGTGGGLYCEGWRIFDVAVNGNVVLDDLDIWAEVGHDKLLKKTVDANIKGGMLEISFPEVKSGQAVISAIAISSDKKGVQAATASSPLITNLKIKQGDEKLWSIKSWLKTGDKQFSDSEDEFAQLPPVLHACEWIQTPSNLENDSTEIASFTLNETADLFIALDTVISELPQWMADYLPSNKTLITFGSNKKVYALYQMKFEKGDTITLLPVGKEMYFVGAVPVSTLDKAIDLRTTVTYQAEEGKKWGTAQLIKDFKSKECVNVPDSKGTVGFVFQVGLASKYGLHFRFMNMTDKPVEADVEILAADDRIMWTGTWTFPSANIKWKSFRTDTQTTINAGTYTVKITPKEKGPLYFDWVKVQ